MAKLDLTNLKMDFSIVSFNYWIAIGFLNYVH